MLKLHGALARRRGATARNWYEEIPNLGLSTRDKRLVIAFEMSSKGGGTTEVQLEFPESSFEGLLRAMSEANHEAALREMSLELTRQLSSTLDRGRAFKWEGEYRVLDAIDSKVFSSRNDARAKEKWRETYSSVRSIVDGITNEG